MSTPAHAESGGTVDVSLGARATTNPYLSSEDDTAAASVSLAVDPALRWESETATAALEGHLRLEQYTNRYGTDVALRLAATLQKQLNELTTFSGGATVRSRRAAQDLLDPPNVGDGEAPPPTFPDVDIPDFTVAGSGARITDVSAQLGIQRVLSATQIIGVSGNVGVTQTDGRIGNDYTRFGVQLDYSSRLSERASVVATLQASQVDYRDRTVGDGNYATPLLGINYELSETLSLTAQVGATVTSIRSGPAGRDEHVDFAFNGSMCKRGEFATLCANASRSAQPTALGGLRTASSVGATYSRRVGQHGQLGLSARYARTNGVVNGPLGGGTEMEALSGSSTYSHELSPRLFGYMTSGISRINSSQTLSSDTSLRIEIGIRHRFGDPR